MSDSVSAETATIYVEEFKSNGTTTAFGNKTRVDEHIFDGNSYTIYLRLKQHTAVPLTGSQSIMGIGLSSSVTRGINITSASNVLRVNIGDGTAFFDTAGYAITNDLITNAYVDCIITVNGSTKQAIIGFYNPAGNLIGSQKTQSLATFTFNTNDNGVPYTFNSAYFIVTNFKKFEAIKTLAQCQNNAYVNITTV